MQITLLPVRLDETLLLDREGDILYVNGEVFDFSPLTEGATLPWGAVNPLWFPGDIHRVNGVLHLTVRLPIGPNAPESMRFPAAITVVGDGAVDLPSQPIVEEELPSE